MKPNYYKTLMCVYLALFAFSFNALANLPTAATNIAPLGSAVASSSENDAFSANKGIDGDNGTRWASISGVDPQSYTLTLDKTYTLDSINIHWEGANAKAYTVQVSTDNTNWTTVHTETEGASADRWDNITVSSVQAKYVLITGTERNLTWGYSFWELQVYGIEVPGKDATLSDLMVDGTSISNFSSGTTSYVYSMAAGVTTVPSVTANVNETGATKTITAATSIPGTTTVSVTSKDATVNQVYSINFAYTSPSTAATLPTNDAANVISVYSDAFTTNIATNLNPGWGQSTVVTEEDYSGDKIQKYSNLNYQGIEYTNPTDVSGMEYVHLDYFTSDATAFEFFLIAGGENAYNIQSELGITTGQWVGVDIPLSYYSNAGRDLTSAFQFKTVGNGTLFLDNIYFWKAPLVIEAVAPTNFTASLSDTTHNSVEFTLSAEDNSGSVIFDITYGGTTESVTASSGVITTYTVEGLTESTAYSFSVSAKDASGNDAANNPIVLNVNTKEAPVASSCSGTSSEASEGEFSVGYNYNFESVGGDVTVSFELLDSEKEGVVAYLFNRTDGFSESPMANTDGVFSVSLGAQTSGNTLTLACKFAFAGGLAVTKDFEYTVGDNCLGTVTKVNTTSSSVLKAYPTPVENELTINLGDQIYKQFTVYSISGKAIASEIISEKTTLLNISMSTYKAGIYMIKLENNTEAKMLRVIKK